MLSARDLVIGPPLDANVDRLGDPAAVRANVLAHLRRLMSAWSDSRSDGWSDSDSTAVPTPADPLGRWRALSALGRTDLILARLAEGHLDAVAILAEAGRSPRPDALYGVWASASGGTGIAATPSEGGWTLDGLLRFCSGALTLDRALVSARDADGALLLLDIDVHDAAVRPVLGSWPAVGMDASESLDVSVSVLPVASTDLVGGPGFYVERTGLHLGGIGVAAVWLGGAQGLLDATLAHLSGRDPDPHQLAHLGAVAAALESAAAVLVHLADVLSEAKTATDTGLPEVSWDHLAALALLGRSSVEAACQVALSRLPRVAGPVVLCHVNAYAHRLADLTVYVRQHHGERDLARLGAAEIAGAASSAARPTPSAP